MLDMTAANAILKELYTDDALKNLMYAENPFLALLRKQDRFGGKYMPIPTIVTSGQARSNTFSVANSLVAGQAPTTVAFDLVPYRNYQLQQIDGMTLVASEGDEAAFIEAVTLSMETALQNMANDIEQSLFRSGYGDIGQVGATSGVWNGVSLTSSQIGLLSAADAVNFEIGKNVVFATTLNASTLDGHGGTVNLQVSAVDRNNGIITFTQATSTVSSISVNDYIFGYGDRQDSATPVLQRITGVAGWIPLSVPATTDNWYGVNRSVDTRLYGQRVDGRALGTLEAALTQAAMLVGREGGKVSHFFMSFENYTTLLNSLGSKAWYNMAEIGVKDTTVSFNGIKVITPTGVAVCLPDRHVPANVVYGLELDSWKLCSIGKTVGPLNYDGLEMLRDGTTDSYIVRYGSYSNLGCLAPAHNVVIQVA